MTYRRIVFACGLLGLIVSAARPAASAPVDVEGGGYGGTASGGWACGPDARAKYGGVGGEIRVRPGVEHPEQPDGWFTSLAAAGEHRGFTLVDCGTDPCNASNDVVPRGGLAFGAAAKGGYDSEWVGLRLGVLAFQDWRNPTDTSAKWNVWPDASFRVGRTRSLRGEIGVGDYGISTLLRPGGYVGLAYAPAPGWDVAVHGGVHETFDGLTGGWRTDLALKVPVTSDVQLRFATALSEGLGSGVNPEGALSVILRVP